MGWIAFLDRRIGVMPEPGVRENSYSIDAQNCAFDITTKQPQLFVCRDFQHLKDVLEEFASKMRSTLATRRDQQSH